MCGAAAGGYADRLGVGRDVGRQRERRDARARGVRDRRERVAVASGRDDPRRAHGDAEQDRRRPVGAGRAVDDERLAGGQPAAEESAKGHDEAAERRELGRVEPVQAVERRRRLDRRERIFGVRPVRPVCEHVRRVGARGEADENLGRIVHVLARDEMRRDDHAPALLQTPDVAPDRLDRPDRVRADGEGFCRRIVEREFSLDIGLEIRHQRRGLDAHEHAAGPCLRDWNVLEREAPAEFFQTPSFHRRDCDPRWLTGLARVRKGAAQCPAAGARNQSYLPISIRLLSGSRK